MVIAFLRSFCIIRLFSIKIRIYQCKHWYFKIFYKLRFFNHRVFRLCRLLQLYLELIDAYKKREINDKGACAFHFMEIMSAFCLYHATLIQVSIETFRYPFI